MPGGALRFAQTSHRGEGPSRAVQAPGAGLRGLSSCAPATSARPGRSSAAFTREATIESKRDAPFGCALEVVAFGATRAVSGDWTGGGQATLPDIGEHYVLSLSAGGASAGDHAGEPFFVVPGRRGALFSPGRSCWLDINTPFHGRTLVIDRAALDAHFTALTGTQLRGPISLRCGARPRGRTGPHRPRGRAALPPPDRSGMGLADAAHRAARHALHEPPGPHSAQPVEDPRRAATARGPGMRPQG